MKLNSWVVILTTIIFSGSLTPVAVESRANDSHTSTGPRGEVRRWEVTGPWGGDARSLVVAHDNPYLFYLGTSDGQIFRSTDGAKTWIRLKPGIGHRGLSVDNIIIDPRNSKIIYAGTWAVSPTSKEQGVFKSEDGGDTWELLEDTKGRPILSLALAPSDSNFLIIGTKSGAFKSADGGKSFERLTPEDNKEMYNINSVAIDPVDTNVIYIGTHHLPWKTTDGGAKWKQLTHKDGIIDDSDIMGLCVSNSDPKLVHINACSGIYRSNSAGEKWAKINGIPFSARRTYALLLHPSDPKIIFAGTSEGLWRSTDGGKRWRLLTSKSNVIRAISIHPDYPKKVLIATDDFGVQVSENLGDQFAEANAGFIHRHVLAILPDATERGRLLASMYLDGAAGSVFVTLDGGDSWSPSSTGLGTRDVYSFYQNPEDPNVIYAGTNYGVYRSNDRGSNWAYVAKVEPKPAPKPKTRRKAPPRRRAAIDTDPGQPTTVTVSQAALRYTPRFTSVSVQKRSTKAQARKKAPNKKPRPATKKKLEPKVVEPIGPPLVNVTSQVDALAGFTDSEGRRGLMAGTRNGLYVTFDETKGWEKVFIEGYEADGPVYTISIHKDLPGRILIGTRDGLFVSDDNGKGWQQVGRGPEGVAVKAIAQDPRDPNLIILGTNQFIYRSTNGGRSWVRRGGGLQAGDFTSVIFNPTNPDEVMVCDYSRGGVFYSSDRGYIWERIDEKVNSQLPTTRVWTISFDPFDRGRVYAGSFSSGVYVLTIEREASGGSGNQ
jgi:photosystem II stability/assembly factor-like uncharacterized protein